MKMIIIVFTLLLLPRIYAQAQGQIEVVGSSTYDFGKYRAWTKKSAHFNIKNNGKKMLKIIRTRSTCACTIVSCAKKQLKPQETATIEATIIPDSIFGTFTKNIYIESSDPKNKTINLAITGNAVPIVSIAPNQYIYAGRIKTNTVWTQTFTLTPNIDDIILGKLTTDSSHPVTFKLRQPEAGKDYYQLTVTLAPTQQSGDFKCFTRIPILSHPNHADIIISISGKIGKELAADLPSQTQYKQPSI